MAVGAAGDLLKDLVLGAAGIPGDLPQQKRAERGRAIQQVLGGHRVLAAPFVDIAESMSLPEA
ncbi:hypothetical protein GCM10009646_14560 [Streptomyces aureus]